MGHPGTLPVLNEKAVEYAVLLGIATNCRIARRSSFVRKHYVYPDLSKGYQITQFESPLCFDGYVLLDSNEENRDYAPKNGRPIKISKIVLEEDAARLQHNRKNGTTRVDYNRSGIPLLELVTAPELRTPREASQFLRRLRQLVQYLGICNGNMEEGSLRCDANISVRRRGKTTLNQKCEIKNLNSFSHIEHALEYEIARQVKIKEAGQKVPPETRFWDEVKGETRFLRSKENAPDYRFLPEPDLPPLAIDRKKIDQLVKERPEMPRERAERFIDELGLSEQAADQLTQDRQLADFYEETIRQLYKHTRGGDTRYQAREVAKYMRREVGQALNEQKKSIDELPITPERLAEIIYMRLEDELSSSAASTLFEKALESDEPVRTLASSHNLLQESDRHKLLPVVDKMLDRHDKNVQRYLDGKKGLIRFFMGQVMSHYDGSPDPKKVRELLEEKLEERR